MIVGESGVGDLPGFGDSYTVREITYSIDEIAQFAYVAGDKSIGSGFSLKKGFNKTFDINTYLRRINLSRYNMGWVALNARQMYTMDCQFILPSESRLPTVSVIETLYTSWANVLDQSFRLILQSCAGLKLEYAEGTDLDNVFGEIYHLARYVDETDDHYRKRLITQTSVLIGCGTKLATESIIDQIIGVSGTSILQGPPGCVYITFPDHATAKAAYDLKDTISYVLPNMFAAGIQYKLYVPITQYDLDVGILGWGDSPYTMAQYIALWDNNIQYTHDFVAFKRLTKYYDLDTMLRLSFIKSYDMSLDGMLATHTKYYNNDVIIGLRNNLYYNIGMLDKKTIISQYILDNIVMRTRSVATYNDLLMSKARRSMFGMLMTIS